MAVVPSNPLRLAQEDLESIIERALEEARSRGASQAEAAVSQDTGLSVGVRLGEVETLEHQRDRSMGITVYFGQRKGSASTADFSLDAVRATVAKACSIARFTAEDACAGLADAALMARSPPNLDLAHPWNISADRAIEIAKSCEAAALAFDPRINNSEGASVSTHQGLHVYGNTHGFVGGYPTTSHTLSCVVLAGTGEDMQRDYWYTQFARLARPAGRRGDRARECAAHHRAPGAAQAQHAARAGAVQPRDGARLDRTFRRGDSRQQPVPAILVPAEFGRAAGVSRRAFRSPSVRTFPKRWAARRSTRRESRRASASSSPMACSRATFFPAIPRANSGSRPPAMRAERTISWWRPTPPAASRRCSSASAPDCCVTELMGQGVNAVTGDYSRGAAGFWVENGAIQYPVAEITIAGNLRDMLKDIVAVGDDMDARGGTRVGFGAAEGNDHRRRVTPARPSDAGDQILERSIAELSPHGGVNLGHHLGGGSDGAARRHRAPASLGARRLDDRGELDAFRIAAGQELLPVGGHDETGLFQGLEHRRQSRLRECRVRRRGGRRSTDARPRDNRARSDT